MGIPGSTVERLLGVGKPNAFRAIDSHASVEWISFIEWKAKCMAGVSYFSGGSFET
jgi:hypothetical protein